MKKLLILACLLLPSLAQADDASDDFGVWAEVGVQKSLTKKLDLGVSTEYRAQAADRWGIGANVSYDILKHLKVGASYQYLYTLKEEKRKYSYDEDGELESYRITPDYWTNRHRFAVDATGDIKLWKWLRISLRERYQFTHRAQQTVHRTDVEINEMYTPDGIYTEEDITDNPKVIACNSDQVLRSRLKLEVDKKHWALSPFISAESHNSVRIGTHFTTEKVRLGIGSGYKINKHNDLTLAYLLTIDMHDDNSSSLTSINDRLHALNISYTYKF